MLFKRKNYLLFSLVIVISFASMLFVGCEKDDEKDISDIIDSEVINEESKLVDDETIIQDEEAVIETTIEETPVIEETPAVEEKLVDNFRIKGSNTNGNLNNKGLVVFDNVTKNHILSVGNAVYQFNVETDNTTKLFSVENGGRATYLNIAKEWIYFVNTSNNWVYRASRSDYSIIETVVEQECLSIMREQSYLFYLVEEDGMNVLYKLIDNGNLSKVKHNMFFISHYYSRLYYYADSPLNPSQIELSSLDGNGKYTLQYLTGIADKVYEMFAYNDQELLLICSLDDEKMLYHYKDDELTLVLSQKNIKNINYEGEYFYFVSEGENGSSIYKVDKQTFEKTLILSNNSNTESLNVINDWLYFTNNNSDNLYQLKPGDLEPKLIVVD